MTYFNNINKIMLYICKCYDLLIARFLLYVVVTLFLKYKH